MWYLIQKQQVTFNIYAKPNARQTELLAVKAERLQIAIHARPHQGEANKALIAYLAKLLRLPKNKIFVKSGVSSRYKQIVVPLTEQVQSLLNDPQVFIASHGSLK